MLQFDGATGPQAIQDVEPAATARAAHLVAAVRNRLQLAEDKPRHHQRVIEDARFDKVRDTSVNHDAGVEHVWLHAFDLFRELDVGDDEPEVVASLDEHADAEVTEHDADDELDRILVVRDLVLRHQRINDEADHPRQKQTDQNSEIDTADHVDSLARRRGINDNDRHGGRRQSRRTPARDTRTSGRRRREH